MKRIDDPLGYKIIDYENALFDLYEVGYLLSKLEHEIHILNLEIANNNPYIKIFTNANMAKKITMKNGLVALNGRLYGVDIDDGIQNGIIFILTMSINGIPTIVYNPYSKLYSHRAPYLAGKIINIGEIE